MKAADLDLLEYLDLAPERGNIQLKNRRMLLWNADAFGNLRHELIESLGTEVARRILRRFGYANGYRDALASRELFAWDDDREWWLSCPALQNHEGKVNAQPVHLHIDRDAGAFEIEVVWDHSYEASQHQRVFGPASEPVCWSITGYASGFASALMGEECYVVEHACAACGDDRCRVIGKTRRLWGAEGDLHAADYERPRQVRADRGALVCRSPLMENVLDIARTVARVDTTVLVTGERGVGKERVARYIHDESPRAGARFAVVNCGALPETLLESALFGHVAGAFAGADRDARGVLETARGGTVFLDEIGAVSPEVQLRLLRALQDKQIRPLGSSEARDIDVRVIAASARDLEAMVEGGGMRKDLYYRLKVVSIDVPPVRERRDDLLPLARELLDRISADLGAEPRALTPEAVDVITAYHWPGNVRELAGALERAVALAGIRRTIEGGDLPRETRAGTGTDGVVFGEVMPMEELEQRYILQVLERMGGNRTHTARALGIGANTLWRKLKAWGVPPARSN